MSFSSTESKTRSFLKRMRKGFKGLSEEFRIQNDGNELKPEYKLKWLVLGDSVTGKSHIESNLPCQDNSFHRSINESWGFAICCDGAGSAVNSHLGSRFIAYEAMPRYIEESQKLKEWIENNLLPSEDEWKIEALDLLKKCVGALQIMATHNGIPIETLASTVILLLYTPKGLLVTHIGDGRAGYCNTQGEWKALIKPHKGEEANQTIFITSRAWMFDSDFKLSEVNVPESKVINGACDAFVLMSDGYEQHSFECSSFDSDTNKWNDPNKPYPKFFDPLILQVKNYANNLKSDYNINEKWKEFLESGTDSMKNEPDDKTMILGTRING